MLKVIMVLDNKFASSLSPKEGVEYYYLTDRAREDIKSIQVYQGDDKLLMNDQIFKETHFSIYEKLTYTFIKTCIDVDSR